MGKVKTDNCFCLSGDICNLFLQKCLLISPLRFIWLLSKVLKSIGYQGDKKGKFQKTMLKIVFSETVKWVKRILFIHAYDIILYINCVVLFLSGKNYDCYATSFIVVVIPGQ